MNKLFLSSQVQDYEKAYFDQGNLDKDLMLKAAEITAEYIIKNTDNPKVLLKWCMIKLMPKLKVITKKGRKIIAFLALNIGFKANPIK